jgi:hypothetical protein
VCYVGVIPRPSKQKENFFFDFGLIGAESVDLGRLFASLLFDSLVASFVVGSLRRLLRRFFRGRFLRRSRSIVYVNCLRGLFRLRFLASIVCVDSFRVNSLRRSRRFFTLIPSASILCVALVDYLPSASILCVDCLRRVDS